MEKQRGMAFGFRKMSTAVKKTGQMDTEEFLMITAAPKFGLRHNFMGLNLEF